MKKKKFLLLIIPLLLITLMVFTLKNTIFSNAVNQQEKQAGDEFEEDNWELSTVFYDSTVNNGNTPLTEINWDASDGGYGTGATRIITVQINYKNSNSINTYNPEDLVLSIPMISSENSNLTINKIVGANDSTHTGYDWNVVADNTNKEFHFSNVNEFQKNSNFEGSIQIIYEITPQNEVAEIGEDECLHTLFKNIKATLQTKEPQFTQNFSFDTRWDDSFFIENNDYDYYKLNFSNIVLDTNGLILKIESPEKNYEYTSSSKPFGTNKDLILYDSVKAYTEGNKTSKRQYINGSLSGYRILAESNTLVFNYQRRYIHKWSKYAFPLEKKVNKINAYDGISGENVEDYIWVEYEFQTNDYPYAEYYGLTLYSKDGKNMYIYDELPEGCVVYHNGSKVNPYSGNTYRFPIYILRGNAIGNFILNTKSYKAVVGYPKSIYNENNNNLNITNTADLYVNYFTEDEYTHTSTDQISINLADYADVNLGTLYSLTKKASTNTILPGVSYSSGSYPRYYQSIAENDTSFENGNLFAFVIYANAKYAGQKLTIKNGDDYLIAQDRNGNYRRLSDDEYYFNTVKVRSILNTYGTNIITKYNFKLYVRDAGSTDFRLYAENIRPGNYTFNDSEKIVEYYIYGEDISESVNIETMVYVNLKTSNISESGKLYNYSYFQVFNRGDNNELLLQNQAKETSYNSFINTSNMKNYDIATFGSYIQRSGNYSSWSYYNVTQPLVDIYVSKSTDNSIAYQDEGNNEFTSTFTLNGTLRSKDSNYNDYYETHKYEYDENYRVTGLVLYDLLPEGMELASTKEEIINSLKCYTSFPGDGNILDENFNIVNTDSALFCSEYIMPYIKEENIEIKNNWQGTNRTRIKINATFGDHKFFLFSHDYSKSYITVSFKIKTKIPYASFEEFGNTFTNEIYGTGNTGEKNNIVYYGNDKYDINENGNSTERVSYGTSSVRIVSAVSTNQDVQVSAQSAISNYSTNKTLTSYDSDYVYRLRVRTGTTDVKNLIIYDSLEKNAKDPNQNFINASGTKPSWNGEFLGVDTSYAESKGYNVKVYYSEEEQPGKLKEDTSWHEYTDSVDKTKVKSLAFEYLDEHGDPAIIPANSLTYVLVNMKSPSEELKTFAYNGCWTEWNAIDSITNQPIDFITGINSNIVKVALPSSVEAEDRNLTLTKNWIDNNNSLNMRPTSITLKIIANNDYANPIEVTLTNSDVVSGNSNQWSKTISVPKYDDYGEEIDYKVYEQTTTINDEYVYTSSVDGFNVTNTLNIKKNLKKYWQDNHNAYLTRPANVTFIVKQNSNNFKEVVITGDYAEDEWSKDVILPLFDNKGNRYTYTIDEEEVPNYVATDLFDVIGKLNTLTGTRNLTITKKWVDNNNSYDTRPNSVEVKLKQNGNEYQTITLKSSSNWTTNLEVPMYDENGVKYTYTVEEESITPYGLTEYNQDTLTITNTLKQNKEITIKKTWVDNNNEYNTRPDSLTITLLQNGNNYREVTLTGTTNEWTTTVEVPKYDNNQEEYVYSIKETEQEEYSDITYSETDLSVINKLKKNVDLTITKNWVDENNKYLTRPEKVKINLYQNDKIYKELELTGNTIQVPDVPVYDDNQIKYNYRIEEVDTYEHYGKVTYDQTTLTVTNELTEIPSVTLYFTVINGYTLDGENVLFDEDGLRNILKDYDLDPNDEYLYTFELKNVDTGKVFTGKLSTKGVLEFKDIEYGTYRAVEKDDRYFAFAHMLEIQSVLGVKFTPDNNGGTITISPTGSNIIYGTNVVNKITPLNNKEKNPNTNSLNIVVTFFILLVSLIITVSLYIYLNKKRIIK